MSFQTFFDAPQQQHKRRHQFRYKVHEILRTIHLLASPLSEKLGGKKKFINFIIQRPVTK